MNQPKYKVGDSVFCIPKGAHGEVVGYCLGHREPYFVRTGLQMTSAVCDTYAERDLAPPGSISDHGNASAGNNSLSGYGGSGYITLPAGIDIDWSAVTTDRFGANASYGPTEEERKKRKEAGECPECGTRLPMSIWGLGECPRHPKPTGKQ